MYTSSNNEIARVFEKITVTYEDILKIIGKIIFLQNPKRSQDLD